MMHTPGPWSWFAASGKRMRFLYGSDGQGFAHTVGLSGKVDEDNARLIAAAPDLLNALQSLADIAEARGIPVDAARAAIAKAGIEIEK